MISLGGFPLTPPMLEVILYDTGLDLVGNLLHHLRVRLLCGMKWEVGSYSSTATGAKDFLALADLAEKERFIEKKRKKSNTQ